MKKEPTISKNYNYKGMWKVLCLSDREIEQIMTAHRQHTINVMKESLEDAKSMIKSSDNDMVACALFEARAEKLFTWIQRAFDDKTRNARENGGSPVTEERVRPSPSGGD